MSKVEKIWRLCEDNPKYEVSFDGEIRNKKRGNILKNKLHPSGYYTVCLSDSGLKNGKWWRLHRLVASCISRMLYLCGLHCRQRYHNKRQKGGITMATITEDYCSFEVAKLLKEKGFNEPVTELNKLLFKEGEKPVLRITHQKAMKWLRGKRVYFSLVPFIENVGWPKDTWHINFYNSDGIMGGGFPVKGYEEAIEAAIKYCLENLI